MNKAKKRFRKKFFTVSEANATLPLVKVIIRDIVELANDLRDRRERLLRLKRDEDNSPGEQYKEELEQIEAELEYDSKKMKEYEREIRELGVELKDHYKGLVDFPCIMDNREVYLCWKQGEAEVNHWHELQAGYAGRKKLVEDLSKA